MCKCDGVKRIREVGQSPCGSVVELALQDCDRFDGSLEIEVFDLGNPEDWRKLDAVCSSLGAGRLDEAVLTEQLQMLVGEQVVVQSDEAGNPVSRLWTPPAPCKGWEYDPESNRECFYGFMNLYNDSFDCWEYRVRDRKGLIWRVFFHALGLSSYRAYRMERWDPREDDAGTDGLSGTPLLPIDYSIDDYFSVTHVDSSGSKWRIRFYPHDDSTFGTAVTDYWDDELQDFDDGRIADENNPYTVEWPPDAVDRVLDTALGKARSQDIDFRVYQHELDAEIHLVCGIYGLRNFQKDCWRFGLQDVDWWRNDDGGTTAWFIYVF